MENAVNKICSKCNQIKDLSLFDKSKNGKNGLSAFCKLCKSLCNKAYQAKNKETIKENKRKYSQDNKQKLNLYRNEYKKRKRRENVSYNLGEIMSCAIRDCLRGSKNNETWKSMVNYSIDQLKAHLESKFTKGMTWENRGKNGWEIDHIIPISLFKFDSYDHPDFKACWDLNNLQPLWETTKVAMSYGESSSYIGNLEKSNNIVITKEIELLLKRVNI